MNQEGREKLALWKYGIIAPAVNGTHDFPSNKAFFRAMAEKTYINPVTGEERRFCSGTLEVWCCRYKREGFNGLISERRSDAGIPRRLTEKAQESIRELIERYPRIINTVIRQRLIQQGLIRASVSQSTIDRFVRTIRSDSVDDIHKGKERKAFEFEYANQCWQADTSYLYALNGRKTYLITLLDDASRMLVGYEIFFADNAVNFQKVLKDAIATFGKPSILYVDNGSPYENLQLRLICAKTSIELLHTPVRDGSAKGKEERSFRTFKDHWLRCTDWTQFQTLEDVNRSFSRYIDEDYNNREHSALKDSRGNTMTPRQRYLKDHQRFHMIPVEKLDRFFLHTYERKVRTDSTLRIDNIFYEVPFQYMGEKVQILIDPLDRTKAWMEPADSRDLIPVRALNRIENTHVRRKQHMKFGKDDE